MVNALARAGRAGRGADVAPVRESRTRERVLRAISQHGPITTTALSGLLGPSGTAMRRHVDNLLEAGLIETHETLALRRGRGRPARSYVVSDVGHRALTSDYDDLAGDAVQFLAQTAGPDAVAAFARSRVAHWEGRYAAQLAPRATVGARVQALVDELTRDGFDASARPGGDLEHPTPLTGIQLCQGHCPVHDVVTAFPQFCDAETEAFSRLLGVHVQRLATLAHGEHVCTTFIPVPARDTADSLAAHADAVPAPAGAAPAPGAPAPAAAPAITDAPTAPASAEPTEGISS